MRTCCMDCGELNGEEVQKGGGTWICMADSSGSTPLQINCTPIKINLERNKRWWGKGKKE